jgi:hypothetical protein
MPESLPRRIFRCSDCGWDTTRRYLLVAHLRDKHKVRKRDAIDLAADSEYILNPQYFKKMPYKEENEVD